MRLALNHLSYKTAAKLLQTEKRLAEALQIYEKHGDLKAAEKLRQRMVKIAS